MNYDNGTPKVKVGIMNEPAINFTLNGTYFCNDNEINGLQGISERPRTNHARQYWL